MLIDRFLPRYDVRSRHEMLVEAPPDVTYRAARALDLSASVPVRLLLGLRALPRVLTGGGGPPVQGAITFETFTDAGFVVLGEDPDEEFVIGVVGRFWRANSGIRPIEAEQFTQFDRPGYAKTAMNLRVWPRDGISLVTTETRILCTDASARRKFKAYWTLIGRFSGFIRGEMLRALKRAAEAEDQASVGNL